jgi:hypothetical protein
MSEEPEAATRKGRVEEDRASLMRDLLSILGCQLAGEIAQRASSVLIPGPGLPYSAHVAPRSIGRPAASYEHP